MRFLFDVDAESVFARDVPGMVGDVGRGVGLGGLMTWLAVDAHVGVVGVGQQTDHAGFFRDEAVAEFVFVVFGVDLPGPPDQFDSVGDFGHEGFGETESPVAVLEIGGEANGVAAGVGGIVLGAVVVGRPVEELEVRVGAD